MQKFSMPMPDSEEWDPFFDDFFDSQIQEPQADPFDMLHRMREQMMRKTHPFDSWYQRRFGGGAPGEIKRLEDNDYIIYQISIKGLDKQSLNVEVKDQQIELKGRMEEKDENGNVIMQSFVRSFPVPRGVNSAKVEIESDQEKIILKFPKLKAE